MSLGVVGSVVGIASGVMGMVSGGKATAAASDDLAAQQARYDASVDYFTAKATYTGTDGNIYEYEDGRSAISQQALSTMALLGAPAMAGGTAYSGEASEVDFTDFLSSFEEAIGTNQEALTEFNRRYGSIMDNVADSIASISAEKIATTGREQLSLDAETIRNSFTEQMAAAGMGRSGMTTEMEMRVQADMAQQARSIDVNAEYQANDLRNQGVQTLNSMENIQQGIYARGENIYQNQAAGELQGAITNANNLTQVSMANASNKTQVSMFNAGQTNAGTLAQYNANSSALLSGINAQNSFYAGTPTPDASNVIDGHNADAAGYASAAGNIFSSDPVQNLFT